MRPGTSVKRTHTGLPIAASRSAKRKRRREVAAGRLAIGFRIAALDVEQHEIEAGQEPVVGAVAEKARRFDRRVQAHLLGRRPRSAG